MAGKTSTLVLEFYYSDFRCTKCRMKIAKTLCNLQENEYINSIIYDEKNSTVTIDGPFNPDSVTRKIQSKLGKMIKNIKPVDTEAEKKKKEEEEKKKKEEEEKKKKEEEKTKEEEKKKKEEEEKKKRPTIVVAPPYWPAGTCCHMPYIVNFEGGCRCCSCGWMTGAGPVGPPMFYPQYYRENFPQCYPPPSMPSKFFWEETTPATCSLM